MQVKSVSVPEFIGSDKVGMTTREVPVGIPSKDSLSTARMSDPRDYGGLFQDQKKSELK